MRVFIFLLSLVLAAKVKGPLTRIRKSTKAAREWIDENLQGFKKIEKARRVLKRWESNVISVFDENGTVKCTARKSDSPESVNRKLSTRFADDYVELDFDGDEEEAAMSSRRWPQNPTLQIYRLGRNLRRITADFLPHCRRFGKYHLLSRKLERHLIRGLAAVSGPDS